MYSNQDPDEQFELQELIGEGAYATVYKGRHRNGQTVAIKIVPSTGEIQSLIKEIQILKVFVSPHPFLRSASTLILSNTMPASTRRATSGSLWSSASAVL